MCLALFQMKRQPRHRQWIITILRHLDYPRSNTKNHWQSIDAHFQDGAGSVSVWLLTWQAANTSFMNGCNQSPLRLPKMHSQNCWRSVDAHFQNGAVIRSSTFLPRMAASMMLMDSRDHVALQVPYLLDKQSLILRGRSFSQWGSDRVLNFFPKNGCQ